MIKSFSDSKTELFYTYGKSKKLPTTIHKVALRKLDYLNAATTLDDLRIPPANRLEKLTGDLKKFYSIRINRQYRVIFEFRDGDVFDVAIVDYH